MRPMTRRTFASAAACVGAATLGGPDYTGAEEACDAEELASLRERVRILSYNTASGGGVNLKLMPDPTTGEPTVPLAEVFSFDRNHALCRVDTNPQAFAMPTFDMGQVFIAPNQFFMAMEATTIEQYVVRSNTDGSRTLTMRGGLSCATEVGQATLTIGSRTEVEHAQFRIEATDGGIGGGAPPIASLSPSTSMGRVAGQPRHLRTGVHLHRRDDRRQDHDRPAVRRGGHGGDAHVVRALALLLGLMVDTTEP